MKNNDAKILRYFSDLMDEKEKHLFLNELTTSEELRLRYDKLKTSFNDLKENIEPEIDERYFSAMLPKIRERAENPKERKYGKWIYSFSTIAVAVILMIVLQPPAQNAFYGIDELAEEIFVNADEETLSSFYRDDFEDIYSSISYEADVSTENLNNFNENEMEFINQNNLPVINDLDFYDEMTDREMEIMYSSLKNRKIL